MAPRDMQTLMKDLVLNECARPMDTYMLRTLEFVAQQLGLKEISARLYAAKMKAYEVNAEGHKAWNDLMDALDPMGPTL